MTVPLEAYVRRWYPIKGARWVAEKRSIPVYKVRKVAEGLRLRLGETSGVRAGEEVLVGDLSAELGGASRNAIVNAAARDGVLRRVECSYDSPTRLLVPSEWADERRAEWYEAQENEHNYHHYWPVDEVVRQLGVGRATVRKYAVKRRGILRQYLADVHIVQGGWSHGGHRRWLFEPRGVDEARRKLDDDRRLARQWVALKALTIECDVTPQSVWKHANKYVPEPRLLLHGKTLVKFVHPDVAAKIRQHYGVREAA